MTNFEEQGNMEILKHHFQGTRQVIFGEHENMDPLHVRLRPQNVTSSLIILTFTNLLANLAEDNLVIFFPENTIWHSVEIICMKCQILFSGMQIVSIGIMKTLA